MPEMPVPPPVLDLKASLKRPAKLAFGAGVVTALITLFMPNYYKSEARLLPVEAKGAGGLGNLAAAAAAFGVAVPGGEGTDANFVDILNSRSLREQLLQTPFEYHMRSWRFGDARPYSTTLYDYLHASNMDQAVRAAGQVLSVSRDLKSKVITLSAETRSPELSQEVVQRAQQLLDDFNLEKSRTRGGEKAAFAEARLRDARRDQAQAEDTFRRFLEANRNYQTSADPGVRLEGLRLENEFRLRQQLVTTLALNREQALLEAKNDIPILNVLDPGNLPIDKSKPARTVIVLLVALLTGVGTWVWENRDWIRHQLLSDGDETPKQEVEP